MGKVYEKDFAVRRVGSAREGGPSGPRAYVCEVHDCESSFVAAFVDEGTARLVADALNAFKGKRSFELETAEEERRCSCPLQRAAFRGPPVGKSLDPRCPIHGAGVIPGTLCPVCRHPDHPHTYVIDAGDCEGCPVCAASPTHD